MIFDNFVRGPSDLCIKFDYLLDFIRILPNEGNIENEMHHVYQIQIIRNILKYWSESSFILYFGQSLNLSEH